MLACMDKVGMSAFLSLVCLGSVSCNAQTSASATALVIATVVPAISVTSEKSINFGVLAKGSGIHTIHSNAPDVGSFTVSGLPDASVSLTFPENVTLQSRNGHFLAFAPTVPIWMVKDSRTYSQRPFTAVTGGAASLGSDGVLHIRFGGSVNTDHAEVGSYSGHYTITIIY